MNEEKKPIPKGEEITGSVLKHLDRRFISSIDLIGMGEVALTIDRVEFHKTLEYMKGPADTNAILLYFAETEKPLKLCATNVKALAVLIGSSKGKDWKGKRILLHTEKVQAFGKTVDAVRVVGLAKDKPAPKPTPQSTEPAADDPASLM